MVGIFQGNNIIQKFLILPPPPPTPGSWSYPPPTPPHLYIYVAEFSFEFKVNSTNFDKDESEWMHKFGYKLEKRRKHLGTYIRWYVAHAWRKMGLFVETICACSRYKQMPFRDQITEIPSNIGTMGKMLNFLCLQIG